MVFTTNLDIRRGNFRMLLVRPGNEYVPENRPPLEQKSSRSVNSCNPTSPLQKQTKKIQINKMNKTETQNKHSLLLGYNSPTGSEDTFPSA